MIEEPGIKRGIKVTGGSFEQDYRISRINRVYM
jgi:hypothetical protein